ncbi:MAG: cytidine deaminase [Planctomycetaceae bacterium]|nr:cytidine deaminase [Planctomycetaceae bacterium]
MNDADKTRLIDAACATRLRAYAPFSNYLVGAALLTTEGEIIIGCNVENISYGLTICAERVAVGTAVAAGKREFTAIAVATSNGGTPCGACRQVLAEFARDLPVYLVNVDGGRTTVEMSLAQLLPGRFDL